MKKYYWNGQTGKDRSRALKDLRIAIEDFGEILDVQKISESVTSVIIEIDDEQITDFRISLNELLSLEMAYEETRAEQPMSLVMLTITFRTEKKETSQNPDK